MPFREEMAKRHLKVSGDLGRVIFMVWSTSSTGEIVADIYSQEYDLRNTPSLEESVRHSDVVYNLVGRMYPTKYVLTGSTMPGYVLIALGTLIWRMCMSKAPRELRMPLRSTMSIDLSMFPHTTRTPTHHPSSSAQRYGSLGLAPFLISDIF